MEFGGLFILFIISILSVCWFIRKKRKKLPIHVKGFVDPRFQKVEQVFRKSFESGAETGAAFAVYYKGELVVDLWGGYVNKKGQIPWREKTMSTAFSTSKGINALLVAKFVDLGYLDYKKKVSYYWPEFAQNGKENITVEMLVSHQAGLIGFDKPISLYLSKTDHETFSSLLAAQKPFWQPGTQFGYHIFSWGFFVDALLMKVDPKKRTLDKIFQEEIAVPFGIDFFQGCPPSEQYRMVSNFYSQSLWYQLHLFADKDFRHKLMHNLKDSKQYLKVAKIACADFVDRNQIDFITDCELREIPFSSFNGHGTARGIAKLYGIISNGGIYNDQRLLTESMIKSLEETIVQGEDVILGVSLRMGHGLMILDSPTGSQNFGHPGYGGQMGAGDLQNKVGLAYLTNNLAALPFIDPRYLALRDVFYECLTNLQNKENSVQ